VRIARFEYSKPQKFNISVLVSASMFSKFFTEFHECSIHQSTVPARDYEVSLHLNTCHPLLLL
jgi:hypothetical protein